MELAVGGTLLRLLPAFGALPGMYAMSSAAGDRVVVVAGDVVRALPGLHTLAA